MVIIGLFMTRVQVITKFHTLIWWWRVMFLFYLLEIFRPNPTQAVCGDYPWAGASHLDYLRIAINIGYHTQLDPRLKIDLGIFQCISLVTFHSKNESLSFMTFWISSFRLFTITFHSHSYDSIKTPFEIFVLLKGKQTVRRGNGKKVHLIKIKMSTFLISRTIKVSVKCKTLRKKK